MLPWFRKVLVFVFLGVVFAFSIKYSFSDGESTTFTFARACNETFLVLEDNSNIFKDENRTFRNENITLTAYDCLRFPDCNSFVCIAQKGSENESLTSLSGVTINGSIISPNGTSFSVAGFTDLGNGNYYYTHYFNQLGYHTLDFTGYQGGRNNTLTTALFFGDNLLGNETNITTNVPLMVFISNSSNVSKLITDVKLLEIKNETNNFSFIEFEHNFTSSAVNLSNITFESGIKSANLSYAFVKGIDLLLGEKKNMFIRRATLASEVCAKDAEVSSVNELSSDCTGAGEVKVVCNDGQSYNGTVCNIQNNIFNISGLNHSAVFEFSGAATTTTTVVSGGAGGGGGGGIVYREIPKIIERETKIIERIKEPKKEPSLFDILIRLLSEDKIIKPGDSILAEISLTKLAGAGKEDVKVHYAVTSLEGEVIAEKFESMAVETSARFLAELRIPGYVSSGEYVFYVQVMSLDGKIIFGDSSVRFGIMSEAVSEPVSLDIMSYLLYAYIIISLVVIIWLVYSVGEMKIKRFEEERMLKRRDLKGKGEGVKKKSAIKTAVGRVKKKTRKRRKSKKRGKTKRKKAEGKQETLEEIEEIEEKKKIKELKENKGAKGRKSEQETLEEFEGKIKKEKPLEKIKGKTKRVSKGIKKIKKEEISEDDVGLGE